MEIATTVVLSDFGRTLYPNFKIFYTCSSIIFLRVTLCMER